MIALAIDARRQRFPDEAPHTYAPFVGVEDDHRYDPATAAQVLHDYNTHDIAI